jgi:hypothetical protein
MAYSVRRVQAVDASCTERSFAPSNGSSFVYDSSPEIRIPVSAASGFLDSSRGYLSFELSNNEAVRTMSLQRSCATMIDSIRIESQGVLLERIERWNDRRAYQDTWISMEGQNLRNAVQGGPIVQLVPTTVTAGAVLAVNNGSSIGCILELDCGFLHSFDKKAIPMGAAFEIVIRLAVPGKQALWTAGDLNSGLKMTNPRYFCPSYTLESGEAIAAYASYVAQNGISWSGMTTKTYVNAITTGTSQTWQINDRSLSLLSLHTVQRTTVSLTSVGVKCDFLQNLISSFNYEIDGQSYPNNPVLCSLTNVGRAYDAARKVLMKKEGGPALAAFLASGFSAAVDLRVFDDDRLSLRGLNTASTASPNTIQLQFSAAPTEGEAITFANCESFWSLQGGRMTVTV